MGVVLELGKSFFSQGFIGWFVILIIILLGIYDCIMSLKVKREYEELIYDFEESEIINGETGERVLKGEVLPKVADEFKKSASKGTENINTEVIISKHIKKNISSVEKILSLLPGISIALGLLGTFLGLTLAIYATNGVLESGVRTMDLFLNKMNTPLQGMASAFWTSIFGVIVSIILNFLNTKVTGEKELFYDKFEDYLDNVLYGIHAYSFAAQFEKFNNTISESMLNLTMDMRILFKEGVDELVSNINKNTLDMTDTAKELTKYTRGFGEVIDSLNITVESFKIPVDNFRNSIDEFKLTTKRLEEIMNSSVDKLSDKIDMLSETIIKLDMSIYDKNNVISLLGESIFEIKRELVQSYNKLIESVEYITRTIDKNIENVTESVDRNANVITELIGDNTSSISNQIDNLEKAYENFDEGIKFFKNNLDEIKDDMLSNIAKSLQKEFAGLSEEVILKLGDSLNGIENATRSLSKNTETIGKLVKATNEWVAVTR